MEGEVRKQKTRTGNVPVSQKLLVYPLVMPFQVGLHLYIHQISFRNSTCRSAELPIDHICPRKGAQATKGPGKRRTRYRIWSVYESNKTYQAQSAYPIKLNTSPTNNAANGRYWTPPGKSYPSGPYTRGNDSKYE